MKKWLDKYKEGGSVESTMDGLTDKGFNYNGAWGGQFQMGGNVLPGAVGFTYARTQGAAPSNGPYAKKTKASAQDGKKLSYGQWKKQYNLKETPDYNLKRAWELGYTPDKTGHLPTVDNQTGQFLKAKGHPTLQLELDWYNSPDAADFRSKNMIDSSGKFFKYVPKSQNGMEMKYYQEGLDFKPKTISQDGAVIDPDGYWNPDNWGNPVIIPSTDITMEGVHQPLIGISDTGDVQYMQPGKDYEFDGEYVTEYPVAQKGKKLPSIQTSDPADPRLHSYLDSVNLNKAYLAQLKFNPPKNIREHYFQSFGKNMSSNRFEKLISLEESDKKAYKYLKESKRRETFNPKSNNDYFESEKELKEYSPQDASLINAYKSLTFSSPTETGLWTTPDLYNKVIAPTDVYFGGKEHVAFNPVYSAPVQKIEYTGNPKDYMKYRSGPTIRGTKYKFNPKSKLTPKSSKPSTVEPKKENLVVSTPSVPIPPAEPKYKMRGDSPIYGPSGSLIGMIDRKTKEFYPDYLNEAARAKVNKTDTDILSDSSALSNYFKSIGQNDVRIVPKKKSGGSINKADEAPIEKLDQLLNFTNYNKATKGGWLDKYQ